MSEDTTQAVVDETKAPAQPVAEATSARTDDDLDALLSQYDESKSPEPAKPATAPAADQVKDASAEVLAARDEIRQDRFKRDMNSAIEAVRGDMPADLYDNTFMEAWINSRAVSDKRLTNAWAERHENPQNYKRVLGALGKEFAKKYGRLPDKAATEDREAVTAAVRSASTKAPEGKAPDYSRMTDAQFAAEKARMFG